MKTVFRGLAVIGITGIFILYYKYNPSLNAFFPKCPFHFATGLDCPGCGSQRAIHALLNGKIGEAAHHNLLLVISLPFLCIHFGYKLKALFSGDDRSWPLIRHPRTPVVILVIVIAFWVLRNIPADPFLLSSGL